MSAANVKLTKEQLSQRLANLSFSSRHPAITDEHWTYRERAAVRIEYDLADIHPPGSEMTAERREALRRVLAESVETYQRENRSAWRLQHQIRHETLQRLSQQNRLQAVLKANPASYPSMLQTILEAYILGQAPPVEAQSLSQLECSLQVIKWLEDCVPDLPDEHQIRRRVAHERLLKPFRFLVGDQFRDRDEELRTLRNYMGVSIEGDDIAASPSDYQDFEENPPFLIYGPGGIGKSALIAKFILEHADIESDQRIPYVYIDFNRRDIDIQEATSILLEACRQLAIQYPIDEERWDALEKEWRRDLEDLASEELSADQITQTSYRRRNLQRYFGEFIGAIHQLQSANQPFLIVLDTFEELLYRNIEYLDNLWIFLNDLNQALPRLRIVISGRSPLPDSYLTQKILLSGIAHQSALELLRDKGLPDDDFTEQVLEITGTSPLSLWLAADLYHRLKADENILDELETRQEYFFQVKEYLIQGQLYKRILGHIHDERVKALAYPGIVLRRVTPELILDVLANSCDVTVENIDDARQLFGELKHEVALVDINQASPYEIRQRPELRLAMLELLMQDEREKVKLIHQKAVAYFRQRIAEQAEPDIQDIADEIYHRLALNEEPNFLDLYSPDDLQRIADELGSNIQDLPARAQTYIVPRVQVDIKLDPKVWDEADLESWEYLTTRSVKNLLNLERYEEALKKLTARKERTFGSPLYPLHVLALMGLNQKDGLSRVLEEGIRRTVPISSERRELCLLAASIAEEDKQFDEAIEHYHRALTVAEQLRNRVSMLGIQLNIYRLLQVQLPPGDPEIQNHFVNLLETLDNVSDENLLQHPTIIRDLAAQIGAQSPEVVKRAISLVGLGAEKPSNVNSLASALAVWDDLRSGELGEEPGFLARAVNAGWRGDLYQTWLAYLEENRWETISPALEHLIETHPLIPTLCITLVELIKRRLLLTAKQAALLQAVLEDAFTSDELNSLTEDQFGVPLTQISRADDRHHQAKDLVSWSEANGKTVQLLQAIAIEHPNHSDLTNLLKDLGIESRSVRNLPDLEQGFSTSVENLQEDDASPESLEIIKSYGTITEGERGGEVREVNNTYQNSSLEVLTPAVCRIELIKAGKTSVHHTAFLIAEDLILTVFHAVEDILADDLPPQNLTFRFDLLATAANEHLSQGQAYALAIGREAQARFQTQRPWLVAAGKALDYALLRLARPAGLEVPGGLRKGKSRGWLALEEKPNLSPGDLLGTVRFRQGDHLAVESKENAFIKYSEKRWRFYHTFENLAGVSGAPIFNTDLEVVGLHRGIETRKGDSIGVSAPLVVEDLKKKGLWPLK